jgi:thiol-disulfide isomerase/thioredoxin
MTTAKHLTRIGFSLALCALLAGCGNSGSGDRAAASAPPPSVGTSEGSGSAATSKPGVEWFKGSLDAAFAKAQAEHKPVLINWGAHWCPYCVALKTTVFTRPDFIAQTANVVAVDLDGDTPEGQAANEEFHVIGYPTLAIFKGDRAEIARVSGGMDLEQYAGTLARVLEDERPISEVLAAAVKSDVSAISKEDCRRLAYHGWELEAADDDAAAEKSSELALAASRCPTDERIARARLNARALVIQVDHESHAIGEGKAASAQLVSRVRALAPILGDRAQAQAVIDILSLVDDAMFTAVKGQGASFADGFHRAWSSAMLNAAHDTHYGESERLLAMATAVDGETQLRADGKAPADMAGEARKLVQSALSKDAQQGTRHDVVNAARIVYSALDDEDALYDMLVNEAPKSDESYYYMSTIARIAEKRGNKDEALGWLKRAYEAVAPLAPGARANYGSRYVAGLTRLTPNDLDTIRRVSLDVAQAINERDARTAKAPDRADHLTEPLTKWATTPPRKAVVADVEKRLASA